MKVSIAWMFDHIDADWKKIDIADLVVRFNQTTAEIEGYYPVKKIALDRYTLAQVKKSMGDSVQVFSPEWDKSFTMPFRKNCATGQWFLVSDDAKWVTMADFGSEKDGLVPALHCDVSQQAGAWKKTFEQDDYILEVDNKSITHRPDMWGHRGFAREIAAILDLPFKPLDLFLQQKPTNQQETVVAPLPSNPFTVSNAAPNACKSIAGIYLNNVSYTPSLLWMASRLMRVDARPIDALVDMTNYTMLDISQPMHAFDAAYISSKKLVPRMAKSGEKLTLLDGEAVSLTAHDLVISDGDKVLALAGVMGGIESGINQETKAILLESASFDASTIRRTAIRYKKRTEASTRFEKNLDPNQNVLAIRRFLKLMHNAGIKADESDEIFLLGDRIEPGKLTITHEFIEQRIGVTVDSQWVVTTLKKLEFDVKVQDQSYSITIPTFRFTKDIKIQEDIVEELGRFYGYTRIAPQLNTMRLYPKKLDWVLRRRMIKQTLAFALNMRELYNYAFFDEEFLAQIKWQPHKTLSVQSPVSENWRRLVTSLMPGLLKAVVSNSAENDSLRFFELARVWQHTPEIIEKKSLAGIIYLKKESVDFYRAKEDLQKLFDACDLEITWTSIEKPEQPWYAPYQTAQLKYKDTVIGIAGKLHPTFLHTVCQGDAFMFELDADFLLHHTTTIKQYKAVSKYPAIVRDISILIGQEVTAQTVSTVIAKINQKINEVSLIDFFEKNEWPDKRAMTFRFIVSDNDKTMTKEDADAIWDSVASALKQLGATIR